MSDEIRADYDALEQVSSQFNNQAEAIQQMIQRVKASADVLIGGDWKGRGVDAFEREMSDLLFPATQRLQQAMEEASRTTADVSQTIQQAEEEACSRFRV